MNVVGIRSKMIASAPLTPDQITDLIERLVDTLDDAGFAPDVSATGFGTSFELWVQVEIDGSEIEALTKGVAVINDALTGAGVALIAHGLEPSVRPLATV